MPLLNNVQNQKGSPAIFTDLLANIPLAGFTGRLFVASDTKSLYRDNGITWDLIGSAGGGSVSGSGTVGRISKFVGASIIGDSIISESGSAIVVSGNITGTQIIKSGGLSSQFLKADGSIDSNSYLTSAVTNVSGSNGSGFLFTVLNPTTTPVISITTSLTLGSVPFITSAGALSGSTNKIFWDDINSLFAINTAIPNSVGDFRGSSSSTNQLTSDALRTLQILNTNLTNNNLAVVRMAGVDSNQNYITGVELQTILSSRAAGLITADFSIKINNAGIFTEKLKLTAAGALRLNAYTTGKYLVNDGSGNITSNATIPSTDITGLTGGVTSVNGATGGGFAVNVTNPTTTPVISILTTLPTGAVPFITAGGALSGSASKVFWDNTNSLFAINTSFPNAVGDFRGSSNSTDQFTNDPLRTLQILNTSLTNNNVAVLRMAGVDSNQLFVSGVEIQSIFSGRSPAVLTANMSIKLNNAGSLLEKLVLTAAGALRLNAYTTGKYLVNDGSGNITSNATIPYSDVTGGPTGGVTSVSGLSGSGFVPSVTNPTTTPVVSVTTSLTALSVPFIGVSGSLLQDNANFKFDNTVNRFSVLASNAFTSNTSFISSFGSCALTGGGFANTTDVIGAGISGALGLAMTGAITLYKKSLIGAVVGRSYLNSVAGSITLACGVGGSFEFANTGNITDACAVYAQAPYQQLSQPAFSGIASRYSGILIDDLRGNTDISAQITTMFGIRQLGASDQNFFNGPCTFAKSVQSSPTVGSNGFQASVGGSAIAYLSALTSVSDLSGYWQVAGNFAGSITHPTTTTTLYNTSSDYRLKENINKIINGLEIILQLKPITGNFIEDATKTNMPMFLAHEVQELVPIAVDGIKDEMDKNGNVRAQSMDASKLIPHIVAAIQELYSLINKQ